MLGALHQQLCDTNRVPVQHDIRDYLITDRKLAQAIGQDALYAGSNETLFFAQSNDEIAVSLYLDAEMLERLETADPLADLTSDCLDDLWTVYEGLSHFNCLAFKASADRELSLLELELQGEVDKFVGSLLLAMHHDEPDLIRRLHDWLFGEVRYRDELNTDELDRYRAANDHAARFCRALEQPLLNAEPDAFAELRRFFRLPASEKLSLINARSF